jgi:hypothetical protein
MPTAPRIEQSPNSVVDLANWELEDNPFSLQGARPKRVFICPPNPTHAFLIGGHRYLFKEPGGRFAPQIWSEIIAYEVSREMGVPVPPAFAALGPGNGSPGVLIEFFYDHPGDVPRRYVDGIELLQGAKFNTNFKRGSLLHNVQLSRSLGAPFAKEWWARTIAFDAVIGNVDRHSRNWGILINPVREGTRYELAPAFDNGSSLGYNFPEEALARQTEADAIANLVRKGHHHCGWLSGDKASAQHTRLCVEMRRRVRGGLGDVMDAAANLSDHRIDAVAAWCTRFEFPVRFSEARALFVAAQLKARRDALRAALEENA